MNGSFVGPISLWNHPRRLWRSPAATSWPAQTAANGATVSWASLYHECSQSHEKKGGSRERPPHWRTVRRSLMIIVTVRFPPAWPQAKLKTWLMALPVALASGAPAWDYGTFAESKAVI